MGSTATKEPGWCQCTSDIWFFPSSVPSEVEVTASYLLSHALSFNFHERSTVAPTRRCDQRLLACRSVAYFAAQNTERFAQWRNIKAKYIIFISHIFIVPRFALDKSLSRHNLDNAYQRHPLCQKAYVFINKGITFMRICSTVSGRVKRLFQSTKLPFQSTETYIS